MDARQIQQLRPMLNKFLRQFDDCFGRSEPVEHLRTYVTGQLSDLPRKSLEPIADAAGERPRNLQQFLSLHAWDEERMRDRLEQIVARDHGHPVSIGVIDDTGHPKKGDKTPGVQRQWCGNTGKVDNCVVTVHLGYTAGGFRCLLEGEPFLPEGWANDRDRCREAHIPDEVTHRPKWQIAWAMWEHAVANGVDDHGRRVRRGPGAAVPVGRPGTTVRGRSALRLHGMADEAAGPSERPSSPAGAAPPGSEAEGQEPAGLGRAAPAAVLADPPQGALGEVLRQRHRPGAPGVGSQGGALLSEAGRPADVAALAPGGPQRREPRRAEVLRIERAGGNARGGAAARGVLALARGTLLRGREGEPGPESLRGPHLAVAAATPDPDGRQPPVPGRGP